ncbi:hypothetical protein SRHO_G00278530 [Serrasalmus rhombeus]
MGFCSGGERLGLSNPDVLAFSRETTPRTNMHPCKNHLAQTRGNERDVGKSRLQHSTDSSWPKTPSQIRQSSSDHTDGRSMRPDKHLVHVGHAAGSRTAGDRVPVYSHSARLAHLRSVLVEARPLSEPDWLCVQWKTPSRRVTQASDVIFPPTRIPTSQAPIALRLASGGGPRTLKAPPLSRRDWLVVHSSRKRRCTFLNVF